MAQRALVLAAHGSHYNIHSSDPARRHAARIADLGLFDQVAAVFWKEFPSFGDLPYLVEAAETTIVPFFMAEGYFSQRVVPRELGLDGPLTVRDGRRLRYTAAVGADPRLRDVIRARAATAVGPAGPPRADTALVLVGHGTVQNRRSKDTLLGHVAGLAADGFAQVLPAFLEESPQVTEIVRQVTAPAVVVTPLFAADGFHTTDQIPRALGLSAGPDGWASPSAVAGRQVYYTSAVGNDPAMVEVILALAREAP
jgi:sirohydrochlorin cobaltochelatase